MSADNIIGGIITAAFAVTIAALSIALLVMVWNDRNDK